MIQVEPRFLMYIQVSRYNAGEMASGGTTCVYPCFDDWLRHSNNNITVITSTILDASVMVLLKREIYEALLH
jgi:hypothetical protein